MVEAGRHESSPEVANGAVALSPGPGEEVPPQGPARRAWGEAERLAQKLEFMWKVHESHQELIRFADAKAGAALVLATAVTGWALEAAWKATEKGGTQGWLWIPLVFTCLGLAGTLVCAVQTIRPRVGSQHGKRSRWIRRLARRGAATTGPASPADHEVASVGLIYAGDVARFASAEAAASGYAEADLLDLADELARDLWQGARVCQRKYDWVRGAVWWSAACALGAVGTLLAIALLIA